MEKQLENWGVPLCNFPKNNANKCKTNWKIGGFPCVIVQNIMQKNKKWENKLEIWGVDSGTLVFNNSRAVVQQHEYSELDVTVIRQCHTSGATER